MRCLQAVGWVPISLTISLSFITHSTWPFFSFHLSFHACHILTHHVHRSSAVMAIGAATLADIYDQAERGTMMGIYYAAPLLGPSLGPILGGVLTQFLSWRATFWFLAIFMGCCLVAFLFFFRDTFRMERSLLYQTVLKSVKEHQHEKELIASRRSSMATLRSGKSMPAPDLEAAEEQKEKEVAAAPAVPAHEVKLSLKDVNPFPPLVLILRRWNNLAILSASGGRLIHYCCSAFLPLCVTSRLHFRV